MNYTYSGRYLAIWMYEEAVGNHIGHWFSENGMPKLFHSHADATKNINERIKECADKQIPGTHRNIVRCVGFFTDY